MGRHFGWRGRGRGGRSKGGARGRRCVGCRTGVGGLSVKETWYSRHGRVSLILVWLYYHYPCCFTTQTQGTRGAGRKTHSRARIPELSESHACTEQSLIISSPNQTKRGRSQIWVGGSLTSISCLQSLAASPNPIASGGDRVPLRRPRSCPPPLMIGSKRTRGRLRT